MMTSNREENMQMRARPIALGMGLILAAGCAGQHVATDYSPATSFSHYKTFALVMPPDTGAQQLLDQRVIGCQRMAASSRLRSSARAARSLIVIALLLYPFSTLDGV